MYEDFTLLVDGKQAFPEIINCINNAKKHIKINMFIWRDDEIGNMIASALIDAANRGVKIEISKDRYGLILEKAEESKKSFFHKKQNLIERIKTRALVIMYRNGNTNKKVKDTYSDLYNKIISHENISVSKDILKADHSKYYIIDDILILGGINIEDKENGKDTKGRVYQDYMVKIEGKQYVEAFIKKMEKGIDESKDYFFGINIKNNENNIFEMEKLYLDMIKNAKKELLITMAYFSSLTHFINEIVNACKRGVNVSIMIPNNANFQDDTNKKTIRELLKRTDNKINVYLSDKMIHTKMIINDEYISFGSTNITKKAFNQLSELNLFIRNVNSKIKEVLTKSMKENYIRAKKVNDYKEIKHNKAKAKIESFLV